MCTVESTIPYKDGLEHLLDELKWVEALVHFRIQRFRTSDSYKGFNGFKGFLITEEEVDNLLKTPLVFDDSESQKILDSIKVLKKQISNRTELSLKQKIYLPLCQLSSIFHLDPFEKDVLLIALAPELDLRYEKLYAYLQDNVTRRRPIVGLILDLLCHSANERFYARGYFSQEAHLFRAGLLGFQDDQEERQSSFLSRALKVNERIVDFVIGLNRLDLMIHSFAKIIQPQIEWRDIVLPKELKERLSSVTREYLIAKKEENKRLIYHFFGPYGAGKKSVAEAICQELGLPLIIIDLQKMLCEELPFKKAIQISFREAVLQPAAIYLDHFDQLFIEDRKSVNYQDIIVDTIEEYSWLTFLATAREYYPQGVFKEHLLVSIEFPYPSHEQRYSLWQSTLNGQGSSLVDLDISSLANKFRFTGGQIIDAVIQARNIVLRRNGNNGQITMDDLYQGTRAQSNQKLSLMAQKIIPHYHWQDILLPEEKLQQLKEICSSIKYRHLVYDKWGFDRKLSLGKGTNILFAGASGTGKTMAAEIIANELKLDLYKIDLATVISKYIGETEKNLSKIFKEAEASNAILFFDEADALFGKRSEVKDSHDRYANIEIAYLLQKMEEYDGISILATNLSKHIDEAFLRRIHFNIEFPFPDEEYRYKIWHSVFPKEAPKGDNIDFKFLARNFKIAGGNIKNIVLYAAFLAADDGCQIRMNHIIQATKREFQKIGRLCTQSEFGKYYELVK